MLEEIRLRALTLLGGALSAEETGLLNEVSAAVYAALAQQLRPGVTPEDCRESFSVAASLIAAEAVQSPAREGLRIFDAGTLSLHFEGRPLYELARQLLAPWLDGGVRFRSVAT